MLSCTLRSVPGCSARASSARATPHPCRSVRFYQMRGAGLCYAGAGLARGSTAPQSRVRRHRAHRAHAALSAATPCPPLRPYGHRRLGSVAARVAAAHRSVRGGDPPVSHQLRSGGRRGMTLLHTSLNPKSGVEYRVQNHPSVHSPLCTLHAHGPLSPAHIRSLYARAASALAITIPPPRHISTLHSVPGVRNLGNKVGPPLQRKVTQGKSLALLLD